MKNDKSTGKSCDYNHYKRTNYFHGMLLTDRDFREEQIYHNEKRRLLNRSLHGWGVVCGLDVNPTDPESSRVVITPGLALDCRGNEILVCEPFEFDLKKQDVLCPEPGRKGEDPCAERDPDKGCKYYVAIRFKEVKTDPVPVYAPGSSCEEKECEYSRVREGFCVRLFEYPPCHPVRPQKDLVTILQQCLTGDLSTQQRLDCLERGLQTFHEGFCNTPNPCPDCCCDTDEPWVVLGTIDLTSTRCQVRTISNEMIAIQEGRRYVLTPPFWQHYLGSLYSPIVDFLDNTFIDICRAIKQLIDLLDRLDRDQGLSARLSNIRKMGTVAGSDETAARKTLKEQNVSLNQTVTLTSDRLFDIGRRIFAADKIEPKMKVDLITDKAGRALFFVPAEEKAAKADLTARLEKSEKTISDLQKKISEMEKKMKS
ncbi:MAG: hypothetical protein WAN36_15840 [Calditrichia bacterium]